jgi:hypothetical protein
MNDHLKIFICLLLTFIVPGDLFADMLVTNSGRELKGTISKIDEDMITFSVDNEEKVFNRNDILRVELTGESHPEDSIPLESLDDPFLKEVIAKEVPPEKYPNDSQVKLYSEFKCVYTKDGNVVFSKRLITKILKERGKDAGIVTLAYKKGLQEAKVEYGRTINGQTVYNYDPSSLMESAMFYRYPDYDKVKRIKFPLPNIVIGSVLDYSYTVTQNEISTFEPVYKEIYFSSDSPVLKKRLIIMFPKGDDKLKASLRYMGEEGSDYTFIKEDRGEYTAYIYEKDNIEPVEDESFMPTDEMIMPRVTFSISPDFCSITKEYREKLIERVVLSDAIKEKVAELTKEVKSAEDKIFNIYDYLTKEIRLIPVTPLHFSYLPGKSDYIYERKAGSYIDKVFLLYTFLMAANIDCELSIVKKMTGGPVVKENPALKQFSYPVVIVPLEDQVLYISSLQKSLMITDIDGSIQAGQGLIVSKEGGEIVDIPLVNAEKEKVFKFFNVDLLEDGSISVKELKRVSGNGQGMLRSYQYIPEKRLKRHLEESAHNIHPNAELTGYSFENLDDLKKLPSMELSYIIKDYMIKAGGKLLAFQMPSLSYSAYSVGKKEREYPLNFGTLISRKNKYILKVPENYKIYYIPDKYSYKSENFIYEASYEVKGNEILFNDSYMRLSAFSDKEAYFELKECLETRAELSKEWIVLEASVDAL